MFFMTERNGRNTCSFHALLLEWFCLLLDQFLGLSAAPIVFDSSILGVMLISRLGWLICWTILLACNKATFEKKMIKSHFKIVFAACSILVYWAVLQKGDSAKEMK